MYSPARHKNLFLRSSSCFSNNSSSNVLAASRGRSFATAATAVPPRGGQDNATTYATMERGGSKVPNADKGRGVVGSNEVPPSARGSEMKEPMDFDSQPMTAVSRGDAELMEYEEEETMQARVRKLYADAPEPITYSPTRDSFTNKPFND